MSEHAPEPWYWTPCMDVSGTRISSLDIHFVSERGENGVAVIASVWGGNEAYARLFSAARELLAACLLQENIMNEPGDPVENIAKVREMRRAAIAKATGSMTSPELSPVNTEGR